MTTLPALLRRNRELHGTKPAIVTDDRVITHAELDTDSCALAARFVAAGIGKGARVGLLLPNGIEWAVIAAAVSRARRGRRATQHNAPAARTGSAVADRFRHAPRADRDVPRPQVPRRRRQRSRRGCRHSGRCGALDDLPSAAVDEAVVRALEDAVRPADDFVVLFTSGSRGAPKGTIHTHGSALRRGRGGSRRAGASVPTIASTSRCRSSGPVGSRPGCSPRWSRARRLLTEAVPEPDRTLALLERERATLFRGWPDQAARLASHPKFATADLSSLRPGSLPAVLPPEQRPAPGARANLFGMTETFGPYCGARARHRPARRQVRQLRAAVRRRRGSHRRSGDGRALHSGRDR